MNELKNLLLKRVRHANRRVGELKESHGDNPSQTHTYHGGWSLGYWEGRMSALEDIFYDLEDLESK